MHAWFQDGTGPRRMAGARGHWVPPRAVLGALAVEDPTLELLVGAGARLAALRHAGRVTLVRGVTVDGPLAARDLVLGAGCTVAGPVEVAGRVVVQASRVTGRITAGGDVLLLGACRVGDVRAGGDIVVFGKPRTGRLEPGGRVATRAF